MTTEPILFKKKPANVEVMEVSLDNLRTLVEWSGARVSFASGGSAIVFNFAWLNQARELSTFEGDYLVLDPDEGWIVMNSSDLYSRYEIADGPEEDVPVEDPEIPVEGE